MKISVSAILLLLWQITAVAETFPAPRILDAAMHHVRNAADQEWAEYKGAPESTSYLLEFDASASASEQTLRIVQHDVKQLWNIELNDKKLGRLHRDENAIVGFWTVPKSTLIDGQNRLQISTTSKNSDDIRIGDITLYDAAATDVLSECQVTVSVRDMTTGQPTPCRITVLHEGRLMTSGAQSNDQMAVRPGVIYCTGQAEFGLPPGTYEIVAGRGPEYGIDVRKLTVTATESLTLQFSIEREVATDGFAACDTHVHTLTHSGHGDSTVRERMLTLAGEGIEFPVATDHNVHIDYEELARELGVRDFFTPVIGNEVTTKFGHFNVFPVATADVPIPDYKADNWPDIFASIYGTADVQVAILNHSRDIHSNYRPFGPEHHLAATSTNLDGWDLRANAMEVVNSAAQQTEVMQLVHDWMSQLNAGRRLTPVGCSDSHDVARHFVGQGRTYIRCDDSDPGKINVDAAVDAFVAGRVSIGCGLFADVRVNETAGPGDTVKESEQYHAVVDVRGPSWMEADELEIFVNGQSVRTLKLQVGDRSRAGVKGRFKTQLPISASQDAFVVAVARGPGVRKLYWPIAKPYQPTSPAWTPTFIAVTGAVWIDADGDGRITSAKEYAADICSAVGDSSRVLERLKTFDAAVAVHAAELLMMDSPEKFVSGALREARKNRPDIRAAFETFYDQWQQSQRARAAGTTGL
ncbi:MAG: CehA/McbA family metallohydrolase [Fuerstiella sp.]|nr:CehA/McbA family metallohydrolase [Fuerstiella sp.]